MPAMLPVEGVPDGDEAKWGGFGGVRYGSFRKLGVPYFGVLVRRILPVRVLC